MLWITILFWVWARLSLGQARLVLHLQSLHWHSFQFNDQYAHYNTQLMLINHHKLGQGRAGQGRAGQGRAGQGRAGQGRAGRTLAENEVWESQHYGNAVRKQQDNVPAPGEEGNLGHFAALPHCIHHFPAHTSCH